MFLTFPETRSNDYSRPARTVLRSAKDRLFYFSLSLSSFLQSGEIRPSEPKPSSFLPTALRAAVRRLTWFGELPPVPFPPKAL